MRPQCFRRGEEVAAYLGLAPRWHQSGDIDRQGRISRCGDSLLRSYLLEAAMVALSPVKRANGPCAWASGVGQKGRRRRAS